MKQMLKEETNDILADGRERVKKKTNKKTRKKKIRCVAEQEPDSIPVAGSKKKCFKAL